MITFYIIGVVIVLLILLTSLAIMIEDDEVYGLDILVRMAIIFALSSSSWAIVFVIGAAAIYRRIKNKKDR